MSILSLTCVFIFKYRISSDFVVISIVMNLGYFQLSELIMLFWLDCLYCILLRTYKKRGYDEIRLVQTSFKMSTGCCESYAIGNIQIKLYHTKSISQLKVKRLKNILGELWWLSGQGCYSKAQEVPSSNLAWGKKLMRREFTKNIIAGDQRVEIKNTT